MKDGGTDWCEQGKKWHGSYITFFCEESISFSGENSEWKVFGRDEEERNVL